MCVVLCCVVLCVCVCVCVCCVCVCVCAKSKHFNHPSQGNSTELRLINLEHVKECQNIYNRQVVLHKNL